MKNPFIPDLLSLLKRHPGEIKIYDLLAGLNQTLLTELVDTKDFNLSTFRKNFWMMNGLYQLQGQLLDQDVYLSIGQVAVSIVPGGSTSHQFLTDESEYKIRDYYLNWSNYQSTDAQHVDALLKQFWESYFSLDKLAAAYAVLELQEDAQWPDIQAQYRRLAKQHHPDKGGDPAVFIEIRQAYEQISVHKKQ